MKEKILFVIESLAAAGAEKSLVSFLSVIDKKRFDIDLQLFAYGGEFDRYIPDEVNLLPPLEYTQFARKTILRQFLTFDIKMLLARWLYSFSIRFNSRNLENRDKARFFWKHVSNCIPPSLIHYDIAVAYAQNIPTLYVVDKVLAVRKFAWVNAIYIPEGDNIPFYRKYYEQICNIVFVSDSSYYEFQKVYPFLKEKMIVIKDMLDASLIDKMSLEKQEIEYVKNVPSLLTVARFEKYHKGWDIALETCRILKERNVLFRWYAIGRGDYKIEMETFLSKNHLEKFFFFIGTTPNPYPYFKNCTLYVQTSRHEGYGLSIAEARILNRPVVTTEFDSVWAQMVQGENGLVVPQNPVAVADAIEKLLNDKQLYDHIVSYQQQEKKGNIEEIEKFYQLIEE